MDKYQVARHNNKQLLQILKSIFQHLFSNKTTKKEDKKEKKTNRQNSIPVDTESHP